MKMNKNERETSQWRLETTVLIKSTALSTLTAFTKQFSLETVLLGHKPSPGLKMRGMFRLLVLNV